MTAGLQQLSAPSRRRWADDHRHVPAESRARQPGPVWWQTCASRDAVIERTLALPFSGDSRANLKTRERGLVKLLNWLEDQPGGTWQERGLAGGAEEAGRAWMEVPLEWVWRPDPALQGQPSRPARRLVPLLWGQGLPPN